MAIAGLHNVSVLDSSFLRESQSQASRQRRDEGRASTRASPLLQMWRELEDEHVVSHAPERVNERFLQQRSNGLIADLSRADLADSHSSEHSGVSEDVSVGENECEQWSPNQIGLQIAHEDTSNFNCDHSSDLGEVERERVRHIFREWMNSGVREHTPNVSHMNNSSRAEWLGETEQERVRIIREWVQMNSQQRGACGDIREDQAGEIGGRIERVLNGLVVNQNEGRTQHIRRGIRRLCGRQALLDMLKKAERERQRELQGLLEHRAVSSFSHRNRIQSLLRGRFLRNDRMIEDERPTSTAAGELGLLRQRHTVSGLREGFFSRLDNSVCGQSSSSQSDTSSNSDLNRNKNEQTHTNNSHETVDGFREHSEHSSKESDSHGLSQGRTDLEGNIIEDISWQDSASHVEEWQEQVSESEVGEWQRSASVEFIVRRDGTTLGSDGDWRENTASELSQETLQNETGERCHVQEAGEVLYEQSEQSGEESVVPGLDSSESLEGNTVEDINLEEYADREEQWQEQVLENAERDWQGASVEYNEWRDSGEDMGGSHQESTANQWSQELLGIEDREQGHLQEATEVQHEDDGFQEAVQNWLEVPSDQEAVPVVRVDTYYFHDDDNVHSMEIRELLSRRSVSNLLRSGFRESLDQLIQSYVERQSHAAVDWGLDGMSATTSAEQDLESQSRDQNEGQGDAIESPPLALPPTQMPPVQPLWEHESHHDNWPPHDIHQRFGIEWEIINDLRIDMARMQQRMNNMQRMLEACMDMQLELQRSIRQEVSAALNRSAGSPGDSLLKDGSKWDNVRRGICCMCCDSNIDSLLYRCGHMCTCSKCANELVQGGGKCPMCWAPVVEVIRAYSIV